MKKNLFTKFLALFLSGAMLTNVGCKDYDGDIDNLNKEIAGLKDQIALKADKEAFETLKKKIDGIDFTAFVKSADLGAYVKTDALNTKLQDLGYKTKDQILALGFNDEASVKAIFNQMLTADAIMGKVNQQVKDLAAAEFKNQSLTAAQQSQALAAVVAAIKADSEQVAGIQAAIKGLLGKEFAGLMQSYMATPEFESGVDAAAKDLLANANSELAKGVNTLIDKAIGEVMDEENIAYLKANDLSAIFQKYDADIASLRKDVNALIKRIQSLISVPEYNDGTTMLKNYEFNGVEIGSSVALKFRVTPAALASEMKALNTAGKLSLITEELKSYTRAMSIDIKDIVLPEVNNGSFIVMATISEMPADGLGIALAINNKVSTDSEVVENDVMSNYALVRMENDASEPLFELTKEEGDLHARMPWNTAVADSKFTPLAGYELRISLDGENYISLPEASKILGTEITVSGYTATSTFSDNGSAVEFDVKTTNLTWPTTLASVQMKTGANVKENVNKAVQIKNTIKVKFAGKNETVATVANATYTISNVQAGEIRLKEVTIPWKYATVNRSGNVTNATPALPSSLFGEVQVETFGVTGIKLSEILSGTLLSSSIIVDETEDNDIEFTLSLVSDVANTVNLSVNDKYAWGKTYDIKYIYSKNNVEYVIKAKVSFGEIPAKITYNPSSADVKFSLTAAMEKEYDWKSIFEANNMGQYFVDKAAFTAAVFAGTPQIAPVMTNTYTEVGKEAVALATDNGTSIVMDATTLKGIVSKTDVKSIGDKYILSSKMTTWYGQQIEVNMPIAITANHPYALTPIPLFVDANNTVLVNGRVVTNLWNYAVTPASEYFTQVGDDAKLSFEKISVDGTPAGAKYAAYDPLTTKLSWMLSSITGKATTERSVKMKALLKVGNVQVASQEFTVIAANPIKELKQTAAISQPYKPSEATKVVLMKNLSLIDANGKNWIDGKDGKAVVSDDKISTAYEVFATTTGTTASAGVKFDISKLTATVNGTPTTIKSLTINDAGELTIGANDASLTGDVTITIPASINYFLGDKISTGIFGHTTNVVVKLTK